MVSCLEMYPRGLWNASLGVCSPADIKIRSVKEGGRPNPKRLQLITVSSPKSKEEIDENDLNLILEETIPDAKMEEKPAEEEKSKKRVPFVTLSSKKS